ECNLGAVNELIGGGYIQDDGSQLCQIQAWRVLISSVAIINERRNRKLDRDKALVLIFQVVDRMRSPTTIACHSSHDVSLLELSATLGVWACGRWSNLFHNRDEGVPRRKRWRKLAK